MYLIFKRFFDILCSGLALLVLSPLLIPIIIGLKLTGEGEVWYLQVRVGYKNKLFKIYKFATMLKNSEHMSGGIITTKKDSRITPMGGFLRKSKINELPQLINILLGDMSVVGPRPVMPQSFAVYPDEVQQVIYNVKPGLTGIGSIIFRDEEELITQVKNRGEDMWNFYENTIYPFKGSLEQWYQKNSSFLTDTKIIILTAWVILFPDSQAVYKWFGSLPKRPF
ncbi:MAG TPA: sugar transferase [Petrimonas sp.]|uniref:sugar transferase n=1 Tax=Petrimonas sp. TaxID=2023866 RepID=UPI000961EA96|nr:MAG: lipid carrier--UDP-N-acetylgalactosaminyltransferase [Bacteroidia bacterium 43-41]HHV86932.1 sugar transferase [Petrimonas sp.]